MPTSFLSKRDGRVLRLTLNRPQKRNALRIIDCTHIVAALNEAELDDGIGAVLIDATGPVFCSGMDLTEVLRQDAPEEAAVHSELFTVGARITKPIVAAVQGPALAGGLGLVANAHVVVAADDATFGLTEIRLALWPFVVFRSVATAIGERRALEMSLTGRTITASDALAWGLVHHLAPAAELTDRAASVAATIAGFSSEAIRRGLDYVHRSRHQPPSDAVSLGHTMRLRTFGSADFREGVSAFFEKRDARWPSAEDPPPSSDSSDSME